MNRRWIALAAAPVAAAGMLLAGIAASAGSAGQPVATSALLCGTFTPGSDSISGQSSIDHPAGGSASGQYFAYSGQNCESEYGQNGSQTFTWTIGHSNVNTSTERGTEHGQLVLSTASALVTGFNGQITNFDFTTPITGSETPDANGNRLIYYASGHAYDPSGSGSGAGNFNTHGGAATGQHFRGMYGTLIYQDQNNLNSPCQSGSNTYCFEAILVGQTN